MNILITGVAGFIGFNCANFLTKNNIVYGIDNFDNFYSPNLKKARIKVLTSKKNFHFKKIDITNKKKIFNFFKKKKIDLILHLAAQAGVRYSFKNPDKYTTTNLFGFLNIVLAAKKNNIKKIIYASSSSVYGENKKFPLRENEVLSQKNIYAVTKKLNEDIADLYQKISNINFIGLRFFTIFGEWGRPDMFIFKLFNAYKLKKTLNINNYGNHLRDFTYIGDVVKIINRIIKKKNNKHLIFNICSNKPKNILNIVKDFKKKYNLKIKLIKQHKADILKTHGNNYKIKNFTSFKKFSNFNSAFVKTLKWYSDNKIYKFR